jgi:hypothetical protein
VQIAPVSERIPCKQGILQGILWFRASESEFRSKKSLRRSDILCNSLRKLTGKVFRGTGILQTETGKIAKRSRTWHLPSRLRLLSPVNPETDAKSGFPFTIQAPRRASTLLLLMLEAVTADLVLAISLKRGTQNSSAIHKLGRPITPSLAVSGRQRTFADQP